MKHRLNNTLCFSVFGPQDLSPIRRLASLIIDQIKSQDKPRRAPDIARLTQGMLKRDEDAYRQFYDVYFSRLLGYLLVLTGDEQQAREALQMTLLRVARHAKRFDSAEAFWSWLTVLAKSSVFDESRRSRRYTSILGRFLDRRIIETEGKTDETGARLKELLEANLALLPSEDRALVERKYFDGATMQQIAHEVQVSEKAIESRLGRIRHKLKDMVLSQLKHER